MSRTTTTTKPVTVFRCSKCGLEYYSMSARKPVAECGRCANTFLPARRIAKPHADTVRKAEREDAARAAD